MYSNFKFLRLSLLSICVPICVLVLICALYCTHIAVETWNCKTVTDSTFDLISEERTDQEVDRQCYTVIDRISVRLLTVITDRRLVVCLRTVSLYNTLLTYLSAIYAAHNLTLVPLLWLSIVSLLSFLITFHVFVGYGPLTGINNLELIPVLLGLHIHPYAVLSIVLNIDLIVSVLSMILVLKLFRDR